MKVGNSQSWKGAISAPETASSTKLRAGSQLLIKSPWDPGLLTSTRKVAARDQIPEETHSTPETALPLRIQETKRLGRGDKTHHTWAVCTCQAPGRLSSSDMGRADFDGCDLLNSVCVCVWVWGIRAAKSFRDRTREILTSCVGRLSVA